MKTNAIIYKVQNKLNGLVYIGATTDSLKARKQDHIHKAYLGLGSNFHEAIRAEGPEAFFWEQIDTANDNNELAEKEKQYIIKYNSQVKGYNSDSGGGFKKRVYQYSLINGSLLGAYKCLLSAANAVNAGKKSISNACLGYNKTCKGFYWSYTLTEPFVIEDDLRKKVVVQTDLKGNQIAIFESVAEASRVSGVSKTCIARCCRGKREHSSGFLWLYI
ncbi:hypothetical protein LCGC14_0354280 [marine sediment metagenome]|uniref:GIY-YIG domain-containing protein n=1 Tax=marine sediment metagenome TaxID=412755 RepID=A0A0F9WHW7_9ZZZZ|nr:NUMOD1 domain-containing DNA-binding protein [Maribacter sp.]HDZ04678.1 endonuclease [Maribacter sp.]